MEVVRIVRPQDGLREKEWLVANGLGGYACGTVAGNPTRRYHGPLVASLPAPLGRMMMLNRLDEAAGGISLTTDETDPGALEEFRLEWGLPVWRYRVGGALVEKRLVMPHQQNTTYVEYRLAEGDAPLALALKPWFQFRGHDRQVDEEVPGPATMRAAEGRFEIQVNGVPPTRLRLTGDGAAFALDDGTDAHAYYVREEERGYASTGHLWSPGVLAATLAPGRPVTLVVSSEDWHVATAMTAAEAWEWETGRRRRLAQAAHPALREGIAAELVVTADSFIITPLSRIAEQVRARSQGEDIRAIIAGYHWFSVWGRDTMIALEGLALVTGRHQEARWILQTFLAHVKDGLIPNDFPDQATHGQYNTADATLWSFHALDRYVAATGDLDTLGR
ncbi:MAG TPA: glycogen debranching enzyme N-terminal domain-containing protein, partial [Candidatus Omnitrophota bacterium]|nr:glycogen debranching enzyme N-terminal domain-containing protein [Candidatus Omnitrophota bacterium]